jgi:hypothetical protein
MFQSLTYHCALEREREIRRQSLRAEARTRVLGPVARRRIRVGRTVEVRVWVPVPWRESP